MPPDLAVFGLEPRTDESYPTVRRAACVVKPLPFYWLGEVLREFPEADPDRDTGSRTGIHWPKEWDPEMHVTLATVQSRYVLLSTVDSDGWQVFDGDDRGVLAHEMLDLVEREDVPEGSRIAMAGRLIERASRVPGRVAFYGR